jgi:hypothetical protein
MWRHGLERAARHYHSGFFRGWQSPAAHMTLLAACPCHLLSVELLEYFSIFEFNGRRDRWCAAGKQKAGAAGADAG